MIGAVGMLCCCLAGAAGAAPHWEPAGWGGGGFFWSALIDPRGNGVMYLGGDVAGVYRSDDHGRHWRFVNRGLSNYAVYSLAQCAETPDTVYAMTEDGICRTDDGGARWRHLPATGRRSLNISAKRGDSVRAVAVHPGDPKTVWAGGPTGKLYRSTDGGESWHAIGYSRSGSGAVATIAMAARDPARILVAHRVLGMFGSRDNGKTWTHVLARAGALTVTFAPSDPGVAYAGFEGGSVFRSGDGGMSWSAASSGLPATLAVRDLVVDPRNAKTVHGIGSGSWAGWLCRTDDGGVRWTVTRPALAVDPAGNPTLPDDPGSRDLSTPTNLALNPKNPDEMFISCNWRNAYTADGGKSWAERSRGADISVIEDIRFAGGRTYAVAMDEGLFRSDDHGASWRQLFPLKWIDEVSGHHWRVRVWGSGEQTNILSTVSPWNAAHPNLIVRSADDGSTFETVTSGLPACVPVKNTMWGRSYPRAMVQDPKAPSLVYLGMDGDPDPADPACAGGFFRSADGGRTWGKPDAQPGSRRIFFGLALDPTRTSRLYWGACGEGGGVYRSENSGNAWTRVFEKEQWIFNVFVAPTGRVFASGTQLWTSDDAGKTWKALTNDSDGLTIVGIEVDPRNEQRIWISRASWDSDARGGIHRSDDGGKTWNEITGDIPYRKPLILRFDPPTETLWAGGSGLFKIRQ